MKASGSVSMWLLVFFFVYFSIAIDFDPRIDALSRIQKYDLLYIDTSEFASSNIIQFRAFDQLYRVQLEVNEHMNPSKLKHTNGNPSETDDSLIQFYTHKTESCHYRGTVINSNASSSASISICDKRGIRGQVAAFGELLIIKPSRYYLDIEHDSTKHHHHSDEHLVYRQSDYNITGLYKDGGGVRSEQHETSPLVQKVNKRRRLSGGTNIIELAIMIGPTYVGIYQRTYPNRWYDAMVADWSDIISDADRLFSGTSWGSSVGKIYIKFKEIELVYAFEGMYADLQPDLLDSGLMNEDNLLDRVVLYARYFKDTRDFDAFHFFHGMASATDSAGMAFLDVMCKNTGGRDWLTAGFTACYLSASCAGTLAHELGHNFGLSHDGQEGPASSCHEDSGLMGYGNNEENFSKCSIADMKKYFNNNNLGCLSNSYNGALKSNIQYYDGKDADSIDESDLKTGCNDATEKAKCIAISDAQVSYGLNGVWTVIKGRCHHGHSVYEMNNPNEPTFYMYREPNRGANPDAWFFSRSIDGDEYAFCQNYGSWRKKQTGKDITLCTKNIYVRHNHKKWRRFAKDTSVKVERSCDAPLVMNDCFDKETIVNDEICVYNNNTLWDLDDEQERYRSFKISEECSNGNIYFTHDVKSEMFNGTLTYYLHLDGDGNLTDYRWIFAQDFMLNEPVTYCENEDLSECLNGNWMYTSYEGDYVRDVVDNNMMIYNMPCHQIGLSLVEPTTEKPLNTASILAIVLILLAVLSAIGFGVFCWMKKKKEGAKEVEMIEKELETQNNIEIETEVETEEMLTK